MTGIHVPESGDVMIHAGGLDASPAYVLSSFGEPDQLACATRAEAEKMARAYAAHVRVSVWLAGAPTEFTLLLGV
jgi:hypothetical protein